MKRVQVFLRAPLFTTRTAGHIPRKAMILDGEIQEQGNGGITIQIQAWRDEDGSQLKGDSLQLFIPNSKVDHIWLLD